MSCTKNILPLAIMSLSTICRNNSCCIRNWFNYFESSLNSYLIIIASRCIHIPLGIGRSDMAKQRVAQHMFANTNERKNWYDVRYTQFSCKLSDRAKRHAMGLAPIWANPRKRFTKECLTRIALCVWSPSANNVKSAVNIER